MEDQYTDPKGVQACGCLTGNQPEILTIISAGQFVRRCRRCGREWREDRGR